MSIMHQSSRAQDRTLGDWFQQINQGAVKLPRFQRFEDWDRGRIKSFLNTITSRSHDLPGTAGANQQQGFRGCQRVDHLV